LLAILIGYVAEQLIVAPKEILAKKLEILRQNSQNDLHESLLTDETQQKGGEKRESIEQIDRGSTMIFS
jgi:hypothetical protein